MKIIADQTHGHAAVIAFLISHGDIDGLSDRADAAGNAAAATARSQYVLDTEIPLSSIEAEPVSMSTTNDRARRIENSSAFQFLTGQKSSVFP